MLQDKINTELSNVYLNMESTKNQHPQVLSEGVNDHEAEHKKILGKLHKAYPEMNLDKAEHKSKNTYSHHPGQEYHSYEANIPVHDSVKHLFKSLKAHVEFSHGDQHGTHARLSYKYEHHNGGNNGVGVAQHFKDTDTGKSYIRHEASGHSTEV